VDFKIKDSSEDALLKYRIPARKFFENTGM